MSIFSHLSGSWRGNDDAELLSVIERAVCRVEPLLRQSGGYPANYRKPVAAALEYARDLAAQVPGPVEVSREAYSRDPFVRALFPSAEQIPEAFGASQAIRDYFRQHPSAGEIYALMGMRRYEKSTLGMELSGQHIQREVPQNVIYFTSHTLENPAPSEAQVREQMAVSFFDSLVDKVAEQIAQRRQQMQLRLQEKDVLAARLRTADAEVRPALEQELTRLLDDIQAIASSLELRDYPDYFHEVLAHPEQHLRLVQTPIVMDSMGVRRNADQAEDAEQLVFNDLTGFDRRLWTVTMVHCKNVHGETFAERLEQAYRRLSV
ncbi:MAG: hypothetical protein HY306_00260 [Nitrosomonadales bacterium]|nr:hypothetical protein [Nitrosomonadales bacterium]